jgi:hypothetical protein
VERKKPPEMLCFGNLVSDNTASGSNARTINGGGENTTEA